MHRPRQLCDQAGAVTLHVGCLHQQGAIRETCGRCAVVHRQQPLLQGVHGLRRVHIRAHDIAPPCAKVCLLERSNRVRHELPRPRTRSERRWLRGNPYVSGVQVGGRGQKTGKSIGSLGHVGDVYVGFGCAEHSCAEGFHEEGRFLRKVGTRCELGIERVQCG